MIATGRSGKRNPLVSENCVINDAGLPRILAMQFKPFAQDGTTAHLQGTRANTPADTFVESDGRIKRDKVDGVDAIRVLAGMRVPRGN